MGKLAGQDEKTLSVSNPAIVHVQPNLQNGQLQLQILPLFFKEFLSDKGVPSVWDFNRSNITLSKDLDLSPQFVAQYENLFGAPPPVAEPEVIKLFDDE